jgi:hypothetical protein
VTDCAASEILFSDPTGGGSWVGSGNIPAVKYCTVPYQSQLAPKEYSPTDSDAGWYESEALDGGSSGWGGNRPLQISFFFWCLMFATRPNLEKAGKYAGPLRYYFTCTDYDVATYRILYETYPSLPPSASFLTRSSMPVTNLGMGSP